MHVLQLGPIPPPEGGVSRNIMSIRDELHRRNHACSILATARSTQTRSDPDFYYPRGPAELMRLLFRIEYDILHLHIGGEIPPRVRALIALCGVVGRRRNVLTLHSGGYASEKGLGATPWSFSGQTFPLYARLICVNQSMVTMFENYGVKRDRLRLIPPFSVESPNRASLIPAELDEFSKSHSPFLLTVGQLEDAYNLRLQIDCMEQILKALPSAGLMIVGSGSLETQLREYVASQSYGDRILLAGDVAHRVTIQLIEGCDALLRTTKFDGDAISIREALHLGTPVIATDNGMRPEGVFLISNPIRTGELIENVVRICSNETDRKSIQSSDGRENINAVVELYEELLVS